MPNHIHGIIALKQLVEAILAVAQNDLEIRARASPAPSVSGILGAYNHWWPLVVGIFIN
jgi:hypothetical protein